MRCAFLTTERIGEFVCDDDLAVPPLEREGWTVDIVPWERPGVVWGEYDLAIVRSTYNYQDAPERFLSVLRDIESAAVPLQNSLPLILWNLRKSYLRELENRGIPIVPTVWRDRLEPGDLESHVNRAGASDVIVKPVVGAGAQGAYRLSRESHADEIRAAENYFSNRAAMIQPFVASILRAGEYSLFYMDGEFSHAIAKIPTQGDFRVQEEFGGDIQSYAAGESLRFAADTVIDALTEQPLYARVDLVRNDADDGYWLMELELIEPSLYLRMDPGAPDRFAHAIDRRFRRL